MHPWLHTIKSLFEKDRSVSLGSSKLYACMHMQLLSHVQLFVNPWTVAHQTPLSMGFFRQEYWMGLPCPPPRDPPNPGILKLSLLHLLLRQTDSLPLTHLGSPVNHIPEVKVMLRVDGSLYAVSYCEHESGRTYSHSLLKGAIKFLSSCYC